MFFNLDKKHKKLILEYADIYQTPKFSVSVRHKPFHYVVVVL